LTGAERGFLLLSSHLGAPDRKPLTAAQLRHLSQRVRDMERPQADRPLSEPDLISLGYSREKTLQILQLLEEEDVLDYYLSRGKQAGCVPVTRVTEGYPELLLHRLGGEAPGCVWAKGDLSLLNTPAVSLVGSRELHPENQNFAKAVGVFAARHGWTLISGNARGADKTAQNACLEAGGSVISIVADELTKHQSKDRVLYLSEDGFSDPFSTQRALSRNRLIHCLGFATLVAQSSLKHGGTWDGSVKNLRYGWSPLFCYADGTESIRLLCQMGAEPITEEALQDLEKLKAAPGLF
jgi:predicted Rossmann fold nucleotide-binding protein DprA/Smf involved in DNA uptake